MAKLVEYDVSDVPESGGGGEQAPVGTYDAKIAHCVRRDQKKDGSPVDDLEVAFQIINEDDSYSWVYTYIGLDEPSAWKMREFIDAIGLKAKGKLDPDKLVGKEVRLKVNAGSYDGEYRAKAGRIMSANGSGPSASEDGPDEDETTASADGFVPTREGDSDAGSYDDWSDDDIKGEFEDRGLSVSGRRTKKAMIEALRADDAGEEGGDADTVGDHDASASSGYPDGYEPQRETDEDSYDDWSDDDVAGEFTDRGLEMPGGRGKERTKQIKALREDDESPLGSGGAAQDDYDNWSMEQLVSEAKERELSVPRGKKSEADIIALLREDDNQEPF